MSWLESGTLSGHYTNGRDGRSRVPGPGMISIQDFQKVEMRIGRILEADVFPDARRPAYKLLIDFGPELGTRRCSAQLTTHYRHEALPGRLGVAVTNFPPRQIGPVRSEVLVLGVPDRNGAVVLLGPDRDVPLGGRVS